MAIYLHKMVLVSLIVLGFLKHDSTVLTTYAQCSTTVGKAKFFFSFMPFGCVARDYKLQGQVVT